MAIDFAAFVSTVREAIQKLFPSDPEVGLPNPDPSDGRRTKTQDTREPVTDPLTEAFLDSGEDVLDPSRVRLFGVPFVSLKLVPDEIRKARYGSKLLQQALTNDKADPGLARIYSFAFEGQYYKLAKPMIFVVFGLGRSRLENRPGSVANWGLEAKGFEFADDTRVWELDKEDMTLRVDVVSGFLSDLLLEPVFKGSPEMSARIDLVERPELSARQDLVSRVEMAARHRARG